MKKLIALTALALALLSVPTPARAQSSVQVISPFICVNQYSFYCYNVPVMIDGKATTMTLDIFHMSYGYVSFVSPHSYNEITTVQIVSMNSRGQVTELKVGFTSIGDPDGDGDYDRLNGSLDLIVNWVSRSSGGGRGSSNILWLPVISGSGSYTIDL